MGGLPGPCSRTGRLTEAELEQPQKPEDAGGSSILLTYLPGRTTPWRRSPSPAAAASAWIGPPTRRRKTPGREPPRADACPAGILICPAPDIPGSAEKAACRKSLFDRLLNFLRFEKSFKKSLIRRERSGIGDSSGFNTPSPPIFSVRPAAPGCGTSAPRPPAL